MTEPLFRRSLIRISKRDSGSPLIVEGMGTDLSFEITTPGIYTIQGDNQSGKSVLIRALMSLAPPRLAVEVSPDAQVNGEAVKIRSVTDAIRLGVVGVFQDDTLIPSMTVEEQILARHAMPGFWGWAFLVFRAVGGFKVVASLRNQLPTVPLLSWLARGETLLHPQETVIERARELLSRYGDGYLGILSQYPRELSSGATAVARIVQAQLTRNVRVLFLDEALSGVQTAVWPKIVDALREWQQEEATAVVVVSHVEEEILRWSPHRQFEIREGKLRFKGPKWHRRLLGGVPHVRRAFPLYEMPEAKNERWMGRTDAEFIVFVDRAVGQSPAYRELVARLGAVRGQPPRVIEVDASESGKSLRRYTDLVVQALPASRRTAFVVVGGGTTLNLAGFVAGTIRRGLNPLILVPTTTMAIADVAVGSKTGVGVTLDARVLKNAVGVYTNPSAVLLDRRFVHSLPKAERVRGLSESMKHGLLQDDALFQDVLQQLRQTEADSDACYEIAFRTMEMKARVLALDPWENHFGQTLLYGHLHAHSIERACEFAVSHGSALYLGILTDLLLAGPNQVYWAVKDDLAQHKTILAEGLSSKSEAELRSAYEDDSYAGPDNYEPIAVTSVGCYADPYAAGGLRRAKVGWGEILVALHRVSRDLGLGLTD